MLSRHRIEQIIAQPEESETEDADAARSFLLDCELALQDITPATAKRILDAAIAEREASPNEPTR